MKKNKFINKLKRAYNSIYFKVAACAAATLLFAVLVLASYLYDNLMPFYRSLSIRLDNHVILGFLIVIFSMFFIVWRAGSALIDMSVTTSGKRSVKVMKLKVLAKIKNFVELTENLDSYLVYKSIRKEEAAVQLREKDEEIIKQNKMLTAQEEELRKYINKLFEQQERERIVKWIVNCIRESLDMNDVMTTTVKEVGTLLKVDRCILAEYDAAATKFIFKNEFRISDNISSVMDDESYMNFPQEWQDLLVNKGLPVVKDSLPSTLDFNDIKSLAIAPIARQGEILGAIIVHQVRYNRDWGASHIEIMNDIASQMAVALEQAALYTQIQETTRLKSEFLANISHEVRTPLNAIIGFAEMLRSGNYGDLSEKQNEYLNNISISGKHLLRLVNDILDLSKVESGSMELNLEKFDTGFLIRETVSSLSSMAYGKGISIETKLGNIAVNADSKKFRQIMYNLLNNAIKFTEDNGKITITSTFIDDDKIKVEVKDTGIGISLEDRIKVFKQFQQVDSSYARKQEGTGLGLTLTKKLIELHHGYIDFESEEGHGTCFWFVMPEAELF